MTGYYTFRTLFSHVKAQQSDFWRTVVYGIVSTLLLLPIPMLIPLLIDEVLIKDSDRVTRFITEQFGNDEAWFTVSVIVLVILLLRIGAFLFSNKQNFYAMKITQRISYLIRHHILHHLERVSLQEHEMIKPGGIASKTTQDVEGISYFVGEFVSTFFSAILMIIGIAAIMLWMNWILALLVFILNPFFFAFSRVLGKKTAGYLTKQYTAYELYHELLNETLELFIQVRASNQERNFFDLILGRAKEIESASLEYGYKATVAGASSLLLTNTVVDLFRALAVIAVAYSDLSIGMMIAFLFYLSTLVSPVQSMMGLVVGYQNTKPALERINTLLKLKHEPHYPHEKNPFEGVKTTAIQLKDISFSYTKGKEVLHHISLEAKRGQKIALVGSSGSGKSTIAQVMVGLYPALSGEIRYDGVPIEEIGLPVIRKNVALMLQDSLFFNDTIRMNLTFTGEESEAEIYDALRAAKLEDFVKGLDEGLETMIGKNGIRLSGGQKQRLALARLILSDPKVVILDEATSALDPLTESQLYETLSGFLKDKTMVIIAHRMTTIKQAEYIYLIEEGSVKAEGDYTTLQKQGLIKEDFDAG
jgi:ATP-binding cassette subfamily C protein